MDSKAKSLARCLVVLTAVLVVFGLLMVYDASRIWAVYKYQDELYFLKRQSVFAAVGLVFFGLLANLSLERVRRFSFVFLLVAFALLILVLIPGVGQIRNGSRSWIGIGPIGFQPSEIFKIAIIIYAAQFLSSRYERSAKLKSVVPLLVLALLGFALVMLEPDFGTGLVMLAAIAMLLFVSKLRARYYIFMGSLAVMFFVALIVSAPYRFDRIVSFIDPYEDPLGTGFQIIQSLYAIGPGGLTGYGYLGALSQHYYLPEPQTDFIFAIVVSDFGFVGALVVLAAYALLFYLAYRLGTMAADPYVSFLKIGLTNVVAIQTAINLMVVVGLLPVTGITLPLLSYGGSSLIVTLMALGLIVNVRKEDHALLRLSR